MGLCGRGLCSGEGLEGWVLCEAARSFHGSSSEPAVCKGEAISNGGRCSGIGCFRRGKSGEKRRKGRWSDERSGM